MLQQMHSWIFGRGNRGERAARMASVSVLDPRDTDLAHRNGHAPYPPVMVVSTERSGLNLIRHTVEHAAGQRTPGKTHILTTGALAFHRSHWANSPTTSPGRAPLRDERGRARYTKLLLLLRDPFEILARAYECKLERMHEYCDNLLAYVNFEGEKLLVPYDNLVRDDSTLLEVIDFLGFGSTLLLEDIPSIRTSAVRWYDIHQKKGGGSKTQGSPDALRVHQSVLSGTQRSELRALLDARLGALAETYLGRWLS